MFSISDIRDRLADEKDSGFTLIELMVVVLIIAILIGIAIPTFLGVRRSAQDRAAQSSLRNALTNAKAVYADTQDYTSATVAEMTSREPSLSFVANNVDSTGAKTVSVATSVNSISAAALSDSGSCFYILDVTDPTTPAASGTFYGDGASTACAGDDAALVAGDKW